MLKSESFIWKTVIVTRWTQQYKNWETFKVWAETYIYDKKQFCLYEKTISWRGIYEKNIRIIK